MSVASYWYVACEFLGHRAAGLWPILISQMTQCSPKGPSTYSGRSQETQTGGSRHVLGTTCAHYTGSPPSLSDLIPPKHSQACVPPGTEAHMCTRSGNVHRTHTLLQITRADFQPGGLNLPGSQQALPSRINGGTTCWENNAGSTILRLLIPPGVRETAIDGNMSKKRRRVQNNNEMLKALLQRLRKNDFGHTEILNF